MIGNNLVKAYKFFRSINISAVYALELARAEVAAKDRLMVLWEDEILDYKGEVPKPNVYLYAYVIAPKDYDKLCGTMKRGSFIYASLGEVGLDSHNDPFKRVYAAELLVEALVEWDKEVSRRAIEYQNQRVTYAA